ncbi:response regulator [Microlunatus flavus]|uniref:DNA-binding response regulator, NarL/FixJ family, contains REC and HTH domains n=1 Tax=Microlunatus flavus TaxID=1036181 RepID=A0A1H8Z049_9ACTN|nr:response regulator transcription factor [Microlunatus flavus]SEP57716.1 DNA-binding response regulator, NarL/FixJ family, contains REC and HTH domains [Microlunatus flavus]
MSAPTRVVLVDDEQMVRAGLRLLIASEDDLEVVGEAADGQEGVEVVARLRPDVVLMDVRMPRLSGLEAAGRVLALAPATKVLMLTTFDEDEVVDASLRHGVAGFLLKSSPPEDLVDAIRHARAGQGALDPKVVPGVISRISAAPAAPARAVELDVLTPRETDVLRLVGLGHSNAEIAAELYLGETTVKTHLGRVLDKLGLRDRNRAIAFAYASGLVRPGE